MYWCREDYVGQRELVSTDPVLICEALIENICQLMSVWSFFLYRCGIRFDFEKRFGHISSCKRNNSDTSVRFHKCQRWMFGA